MSSETGSGCFQPGLWSPRCSSSLVFFRPAKGHSPKILPEKKAVRLEPKSCIRSRGPHSPQQSQFLPPLWGAWASQPAWAACQRLTFKGLRTFWRTCFKERARESEAHLEHTFRCWRSGVVPASVQWSLTSAWPLGCIIWVTERGRALLF